MKYMDLEIKWKWKMEWNSVDGEKRDEMYDNGKYKYLKMGIVIMKMIKLIGYVVKEWVK